MKTCGHPWPHKREGPVRKDGRGREATVFKHIPYAIKRIIIRGESFVIEDSEIIPFELDTVDTVVRK